MNCHIINIIYSIPIVNKRKGNLNSQTKHEINESNT